MTEQDIKKLLKVYDSNIIATKTDLKGVITYSSKAFENISGYTQKELIGKDHNIVRHEDTPKELFKELWETIKSGNSWEGEIKNKKKNGEVYWVKAYIEPEYKDNKIIGYSAIRIDITDKKKLEELNQTLESKIALRTQEIKQKLYFDDLTALGTNFSLIENINECEKIFNTLILINIDNFQNINSVYGFDIGNRVLISFSEFLIKFNKSNPYKLFRVYADEFALLKDIGYISSLDKYYSHLLELKKQISNFEYYIKEFDEFINIEVTIGLSFSQENPLATADMALRYAKKHKLGFQVYNSEIDSTSKLQNSLSWRKKLKNALKDDRVIPIFHPIVNRDEEIIKYEILIRIQEKTDDKNSLISPNQFLEEAINAKIYTDLVINIFKKAFKIINSSEKIFSINLSFNDLFNKPLIDFLEKSLKDEASLDKKLVFEILETHEINDIKVMDEFLIKFRKYGVKIAIDDFGVGHSNLSHIVHIQPDYIKIDGSFIKDINKNKQSFYLVKSIIALSKELNIKVIAEYVHSKEIFEILKDMGINEFQGYYFSEPILDI